MDMVSVLRRFIVTERTGNFSLYLKTLQEMLPYFAASGHTLYRKSVHLHLQSMTDLKEHNPALYANFQDGLFLIRKSDHFWAARAPGLVIEQALMRSIKSTGGVTRGRGMTESQRAI